MSSPFVDVSVQPSYGRGSSLVTWKVNEPFQRGDFYIYRSETGEAPWLLLNPRDADGKELPIRALSFEDKNMRVPDLQKSPHYRLLLEYKGQQHKSPVVGAFGLLTRWQYKGLHNIMRQDLRDMRHSGVPMWHCIPLTFGELNPNVDPDTYQVNQVDCPDSDTQSYGLPFKGGYGAPIPTFVVKGQTTETLTEKDDSLGDEQTVICEGCRMPAFPTPARGHMLIHPATDERWVVTDAVTPFMYRGLAVIDFKLSMKLLRRSDPRYKFPVPPFPSIPII